MDELFAIQKILDDANIEASTQIDALNEQVKNLRQERDSLQSEKSQLELQMERRIEDFSANLAQAEDQNSELANQGHRDKDDRDVEESQKIYESKNQTVNELEEVIEDLKRELEMKVDEISTLVENVRTLEVKLRLANQKIRVTEQLLTENEESYKSKEEKLHNEQALLEEGYSRKTMAIWSPRIYEILNEFKLRDEKEHGLVLTEKVGDMEKSLQKGEDEKISLVKSLKGLEEKLGQLEKVVKEKDEMLGELEQKIKSKDDGISELGEEKREAIRQLCIWIDYHRNRYDDLKEMISKTSPARRQITA
nr:COP1-interactive protein 1-like [Coffea arabica]